MSERESCAACAGQRRSFAPAGTAPRYPPDRPADFRHLRLDLTVNPEKRSLAGIATYRLAPVGRPLGRLGFDCCELTVDSVRMGGRELRFEHEGGRLDAFLDRALPVGREAEVEVRYHGSPRTGLNFTGPDKAYPDRPFQAWSQGQDEYARYWFPSHDFPNQKSTTEMIVTAPARYETVGNGRLVSVKKSGGNRVWHWSQEVPQVAYLVSLVVAEFEHWTDHAGQVPIENYVPPGRLADGKRAFKRTPDMIRLFEEVTGQPYPYEKYGQVVVRDFTWGGMENTTATTLVDTVVYDARAELDYGYAADNLIAHELAHQWFGDYLTCREWAHAWLNEGFASYFEWVWEESALGLDTASVGRIDDAAVYFSEDEEYRRPIVHRTYVDPHDLFDRHLYEKGAWVLWMLRKVVGDELFLSSVREYVARHRQALVVTEDLVRAFEDVTGRSLGWFFDQWVFGAGHPEFEVGYSWDAEGGTAAISVKQAQKVEGDTHVFRAPLVVAFGQPGGRAPVEQEVEVGARGRAEDAFTFQLPNRPTWVRFDRGNHVLKRLKFERAEELLLGQLREDEATGRMEAATELGRKGTPRAVEALIEALNADPFWGVRRVAATALGTARTVAARDALTRAMATEKEARARLALASSLGAFRGDDVAAAAATKALGDRAYGVAAAAAHSLGRLRVKGSIPGLRRALKLPSHRDLIRQQALAGMAALGDGALLPEMLEWSRPGLPERLRAAALTHAARLAASLPREARRPVRDAALEALRDPLYFVRRGGIQALEILGEPEGIGPIRALMERDVEGAVRGDGHVAIERLSAGRSREEALKTVRDEVSELRTLTGELRERLLKLEAPGPAGARAKRGRRR